MGTLRLLTESSIPVALGYWDCRRDGNSLIGGRGGKPPGRLTGTLGPAAWAAASAAAAAFSVRIGREGITLGLFSGPPVVGMLTPIPPDTEGSPVLGFT